MDQLTHTVRRSNWINIIRQCQDRPAGTTAKQWLAENDISEKTSIDSPKADFILIPFLCQQEITDVAVLDPVSAHVELIQRDNIFRVVIADIVIRAELTLNSLIGCQQIGNLNIQFFSTLVTYKVDLLVSGSADSHFIVPAQQLQKHDVLQNERE